jgi:hypothetical protein
MPTTYRGGCRCGAIRYEIAAEPMFGGHCQCLDCQHETGGGHASFMAFPAAAMKLAGTPRYFESKADSGNTVRRGFCPTCGSPVTGGSSGLPDITTISVGSLDDPSVFKPAFVVYTSRGHAWDRVDPAVPSFPNTAAVVNEFAPHAWRRATSRMTRT